jgi:hypothetical protein
LSVGDGFAFVGPTSATWDNTLVAIVDGLSAAGLSFEVSVVVNWEVIPSTPFAGILSTEKSLYDVDALMLAFNTSQGTDMFQSYPADAYDSSNTMFTNATSPSIWSSISSLNPGQIASSAAEAAERIMRVAYGGFSLWRMASGSYSGTNSLGYDRPKQIVYA